MSWDVVVFSTTQNIVDLEDVKEDLFIPVDFDKIIIERFNNIIFDDDHREIKGVDYAICYFANDEPIALMTFNLYGENALFAIIEICKTNQWQIFDTGIGEMINLEHPEKNGYDNFQAYLAHVLNSDKEN